MPLKKGSSKATISANIHELVKSKYPVKQAVAIAPHTAKPKERFHHRNGKIITAAHHKRALKKQY